MNKFQKYLVILWIFCLVTLGIVSVKASMEIAEQRKNIDNMEKRSKPTGR